MMKWQMFLMVAVAWLVTACAAPVAPSNEYLLMDTKLKSVEAQTTHAIAVQLMPVYVANYLAGNEIVLVTKQGEVHRSKSNLWAETLSSQLTRLTQQRLEKALPNITWFGGQRLPASAIATLSIDVDDFYADLEGVIHISGRWQLISDLGELSVSNTFSVKDILKSDGYSTMVQTLSNSWFNHVIDSIGKDIAKTLSQ